RTATLDRDGGRCQHQSGRGGYLFERTRRPIGANAMSDIEAPISVLKHTADPAVADAIARLIENGADRELNRINALDFSGRTGLDEEKVISGFLHASRLGLFDLSWNVLCPGCGGVLGAHDTLKSLQPDDYHCGL